MSKGLDKQVYIHSIETSAFYNEKEQRIHKSLKRYLFLKSKLKDNKGKKKTNRKKSYSKKKILSKRDKKLLNSRIEYLSTRLKNAFTENKGIRTLSPVELKDTTVISIFESTLSRTIGMKENELSTDIMVVRVYHYEILKSLIDYGYTYDNEKYIYFSSSAGQIRTKKAVFIKKSVWEKHKNTLTCGLSVEEINAKGGMNVNKYLAYLALTNGATNEWKGFNIDRTIVVDDLSTNVHSLVDYIDRDTYEITRKEMDIEIEHTDGCGMILPHRSRKSFMCRLPFVKGLLVPFDFKEFSRLPNATTKITDIYGKEWDILEDNIHIIFTKSQFKMWKYYDSWDDYKTRFKQHKCKAAKLNEEDTSNDAMLNYQMLQTLTDATVEELTQLCESTKLDIELIGKDKDTMLRVLGASSVNKRKNYFQQALSIYPELLNTSGARKTIKDKKRSMVREAWAGKINVNGKYTFICPDLYAFCEKLFMKINNPKGLLLNNEVYCSIFNEGKADILRAPHLYKEHAVRNNVKDKLKANWFITNGVYTSVFDVISKILQFDNDGDKGLVVQDEMFISIAERNMQDVVPLYYEMSKAEATQINSESIYTSLTAAYRANIGEISNNITKIWNSSQMDLNAVKWLCMESNFTIDYAKTLFMPTRPNGKNEILSSFTNKKVPHFFIYAKEKDVKKVEIKNDSTVNKLIDIIPNKPIQFQKIAGNFNYKMGMKKKKVKLNKEIVEMYTELDKEKNKLIKKMELKSYDKLYVYKVIRDKLVDKFQDIEQIVDVLFKHCYHSTEDNEKNKTTLWESFGDIILENIEKNLSNSVQCGRCGIRVIKKSNKTIYCLNCAKKIEKEKTKQRVKKFRESKKNVTV